MRRLHGEIVSLGVHRVLIAQAELVTSIKNMAELEHDKYSRRSSVVAGSEYYHS